MTFVTTADTIPVSNKDCILKCTLSSYIWLSEPLQHHFFLSIYVLPFQLYQVINRGLDLSMVPLLISQRWLVGWQLGRDKLQYKEPLRENHIEAGNCIIHKETNTGEVVGRLSGDMVLIQDAMGEKVGKFIQLMAPFVTGFAVVVAIGGFSL